MGKERSQIEGYIFAVVSSVSFSAKGIFAKIIYAYGVEPVTLLALRFAIAAPFFWLLVLVFPSGRTRTRDVAILFFSGFIGIYAAALCDFYGLLYLDATLERIIMYTYPAIVVVLAAVFFKERMGARKVISLVLTYTGLFLALKVYSSGFRLQALGAVLVFFSAVIFSVSYLITEVLARRVSAVKISAYSTTAAAAAFITTWHGRHVPEEPAVWAWLALTPALSTLVPEITATLAIKRIGASRSAVVSSIGPVSTALLAWVVLGERMDALQAAGMALVIAGVMVISRGKKGEVPGI